MRPNSHATTVPFLQKIHESITRHIVVRKVIDPEFIELRECLRIYKENHETGLSFTIPNFIFLPLYLYSLGSQGAAYNWRTILGTIFARHSPQFTAIPPVFQAGLSSACLPLLPAVHHCLVKKNI